MEQLPDSDVERAGKEKKAKKAIEQKGTEVRPVKLLAKQRGKAYRGKNLLDQTQTKGRSQRDDQKSGVSGQAQQVIVCVCKSRSVCEKQGRVFEYVPHGLL